MMTKALEKEILMSRFLSKVFKTDNSCWIWLGARTKGYGSIRGISSEGSKSIAAHRISYELFVGQIPKDLQIDHLCRIPLCVNPKHLEAVTHRENQIRGVGFSAINIKRTHCVNGHEFSLKNTRVQKSGKRKGRRICKACMKIRERKYKLKEPHQ